MKHILLLLVLTSCYDRNDAVAQVRAAGGTAPIACVRSGRGDTFVCSEGSGKVYTCSYADNCIVTGHQ